MILMILFALICALATITVLSPITAKHSQASITLMMLIPSLTLGLYMLLGAPNIPSAAALFDTNPQNQEARASVTRELDTMRELSENPQDTQLIMRLAGLRMKQGKFDDAATLLGGAITAFPDDDMLKTQLAAAYYAKAMILIEGKRFAESMQALEKAKDAAPAGTPFLEDINAILPELKKLL